MFRPQTSLPNFLFCWAVSLKLLFRFALILTLGSAALYFTNNAVNEYRYVFQIRAGDRSTAVVIHHTERKVVGKSTQKNRVKSYHYRAVFRYRNQERMMPVTQENYERLRPGDAVRVLYNTEEQHFIPADYLGDHRRLITPLIFWAMLAGVLGHGFWVRHNRKPLPGKPIGNRLHRSPGQFA